MKDRITDSFWLHLIASGNVLALVFYFQYEKNLAPCELCIWQRWPYVIVLLLSNVALHYPKVILLLLISFSYLATMTIASFHVGVEQGWWEGLSSCGSTITATDPVTLMEQLKNAPLVRCEEVAWQYRGLSMAAWNAILSFTLAVIALYQWRFYYKPR